MNYEIAATKFHKSLLLKSPRKNVLRKIKHKSFHIKKEPSVRLIVVIVTPSIFYQTNKRFLCLEHKINYTILLF